MPQVDQELKDQYKKQFGKKPMGTWTEDQIRNRMAIPEYKVEKEPEPVKEPEPEPTKDEDTITMSKSEFRRMLTEAQDEIRSEQKKYRRVNVNQWEEVKDEKAVSKAHLKIYQKDGDAEKGVIIDWKLLRKDRRVETPDNMREIYKLAILYDDNREEFVEMPLYEFALIKDVEVVDIIETKARKMVQKLGKIRRALKNKEGYLMGVHPDGNTDNVMVGGWVDEEVTRMEETHTIRRESGVVMEIANDRLNA